MIEDEAQQQTQNDKIQMIEISQLEIQLYLAITSNIQREIRYDYPYISSAVQNMLQYYFSKFSNVFLHSKMCIFVFMEEVKEFSRMVIVG